MPADPRIDAYIAAKADFARPILERVRERVHAICPEIEESIKWSRPAYLYQGKLLVLTAAFQQHVRVSFWQRDGLEIDGAGFEGLGRVASLAALPDDRALDAVIAQALARRRSGEAPAARPIRTPRPEAEVPAELAAALAGDRAAAATFAGFPPSCRREYCDWIAEARRPETRARRVAETVAQLRVGKRRYDRHGQGKAEVMP